MKKLINSVSSCVSPNKDGDSSEEKNYVKSVLMSLSPNSGQTSKRIGRLWGRRRETMSSPRTRRESDSDDVVCILTATSPLQAAKCEYGKSPGKFKLTEVDYSDQTTPKRIIRRPHSKSVPTTRNSFREFSNNHVCPDLPNNRLYKTLAIPFLQFLFSTIQDISVEDEALVISKYFDYKRCYDVMPVSGKVVVLEVHLQVEKAFHSLVAHMMRAAPLWDSTKMKFVGMLTITDFIDILLLYYHSSEEQIKDLETQKIFEWRSITNRPDNFINIHPEASLTEAIKILVQKQVHRLPIYCPKQHAVLFVLTHKRILKYFYLFGLGKSGTKPDLNPYPSCFKTTIRELRIGTYENIATATLEITVIDALKIFAERKVSALPVVQDGRVVNIYAKFDVLALAKGKTYGNLDMTIGDALRERGEVFEEVVTCTLEDTLEGVLNKIIECQVHRLVVVDTKQSVIGMLSLSDILKFLVLKPLGLLNVPVSSLAETENESEVTPINSFDENSQDASEMENFQQTLCDEDKLKASSDNSQKCKTECNSEGELVSDSPTLPEESLKEAVDNKEETCEDSAEN